MSGKLRLGGLLLALALGLPLAAGRGQAADTASPAEQSSASTKTLKERLSDKASDEQRVDNCKVPMERRGPKPRPEGCGPAQTGGTPEAAAARP